MIGGREPLRGRRPGDRRVRVERPHAPYFRYSGKNVLTAKAAATRPDDASRADLAERARRMLFGRPLATEEEAGERLSKTKALAIFSSDAISSSAYATEEILRALLVGGVASLPLFLERAGGHRGRGPAGRRGHQLPPGCLAYPTGGGSYSVSKANFGRMASLVAASALLIDYMLTVAVSISSASEQIVAAIPDLHAVAGRDRGRRHPAGDHRQPPRPPRVGQHLRGIPTYLFVGMALLMIALGAYQIVVLGAGRARLRGTSSASADMSGGRAAAAAAARLRIRRGGAHRHGGDRHRRARVQATRVPQRRRHARRDGRAAGDPVRGHHVRGQRVRHPARTDRPRRSSPRSPRMCSATAPWATTCC